MTARNYFTKLLGPEKLDGTHSRKTRKEAAGGKLAIIYLAQSSRFIKFVFCVRIGPMFFRRRTHSNQMAGFDYDSTISQNETRTLSLFNVHVICANSDYLVQICVLKACSAYTHNHNNVIKVITSK